MATFEINKGSVYQKLINEIKPEFEEKEFNFNVYKNVLIKTFFEAYPDFPFKFELLQVKNAWELILFFFKRIKVFNNYGIHFSEAPFLTIVYSILLDEEAFTEDEWQFIILFSDLQKILENKFTQSEKSFLYAISKQFDSIFIAGENKQEKKLILKINKFI